MPIHDYRCKNTECLHEWQEFYRSFSEVTETEHTVACPKCSGLDKERLITTANFQLKGGGWYRDGYGGGGAGLSSKRSKR